MIDFLAEGVKCMSRWSKSRDKFHDCRPGTDNIGTVFHVTSIGY